MLRISLSDDQRQALHKHRKNDRSQAAERCTYVLLADQGLSIPQIADRLHRHEHTIRYWLKAYQRQELIGLAGTSPPGRPNRQGAHTLRLLEQTLSRAPTDFGYIETGWTVDLLRDYFQRAHHHCVSDTTVRRMLKAGGWRYKRSKKSVPRQAPSPAEKKSVWHRSSPKSKPLNPQP